jgi:hypothetical protein
MGAASKVVKSAVSRTAEGIVSRRDVQIDEEALLVERLQDRPPPSEDRDHAAGCCGTIVYHLTRASMLEARQNSWKLA